MTTQLGDVLALIARREFPSALEARRIARYLIEDASGATLLALHEVIAHAVGDLLTELGEHGRENEALFNLGVDFAWLDVQAIVDEHVAAWREIERLRADGTTSKPLFDAHLANWMFPIGSADWLTQTQRMIEWRDADWVRRVTARLRRPDGQDDEDDD